MIPPGEKTIEQRSCKHCKKVFEITDADIKFYETLDVPFPTWCPECRLMRKMAWCNEWVMYTNECLFTKKPLISQFPKTDPRKVLSLKAFFSDEYDPLLYWRDIDFERSIFEQIHELEVSMPHLYAAVDSVNENSEYIHRAGQAKNCFLLFHADFNEDCYYGYGIKKSKNCMDNHYCHESNFCFECIDVKKCSNMNWCQNCENSANCSFCRDCLGCRDCFLSVGLRNKTHYFMNEACSPEEYQDKLKNFRTGSYSHVQKAKQLLETLEQKHSFKNLNTISTENSFWDNLRYTKNAWNCFDCSEIEDCKYCYQVQFWVKNCYDLYQYGVSQDHCIECTMMGINASNCKYSYTCDGDISGLEYCMNSFHSKDCFACQGLKKHQYCILNKQYTEEEYKVLRWKIIEKMKADGEWWEFFPIKYSESCYNETIAQQWFPKTKEEVLALWWRWQDNMPGTYGKETITHLPDDIRDAKADIVEWICKCETCSKNYRIIPQELDYLYKNSLPLPRECFDCRRQRRFNKRNKRVMRDVSCHECWKVVPTTYPENFTGKICCEKCYRKLVY